MENDLEYLSKYFVMLQMKNICKYFNELQLLKSIPFNLMAISSMKWESNYCNIGRTNNTKTSL